MNAWTWRMMLRETRASWKRLVLFLLCISAGVGGLVAIKSFSHNLTRAVELEARSLMSADLILRSRRAFTASELDALNDLRQAGAEVVESLQFLSMARSTGSDRVQLVGVRTISAGYPFYGEVSTDPPESFRKLLDEGTVLVHNTLLLKMRLKVGDPLQIGQRVFRIAGVLVKEPDSPVQAFNMGPRVLMTDEGGRATGLIGPYSRINYHALVRLPPNLDSKQAAQRLRDRLPDSYASIDSFDQARPRAARFLVRLTDFLNLVGLAALLLGGIGVAGAVRAFLAQKLDTLAVLKCLGATSDQLFSVYLGLTLLIGLTGSLVGAALGFALQWALPYLLADLMPVSLQLALPPSAALEGLLLGGLTTLWFSAPPLWEVRRVPPALVFRRDVEPARNRYWRIVNPLLGMFSVLMLAALLSVWQAGLTRTAVVFVIGLGAGVAGLNLAALGLLLALRQLPKPALFELKQGLSGLYRPGNQSAAVVMSLGLGVLLLLAVFLAQQDLLRQVSENAPVDQPNLFFFDIQTPQREDFHQVLVERGYPEPKLIPIVRGRIAAINGKPLAIQSMRDAHRRNHLRFEYTFTYRDTLEKGEEVVAGRFGPPPGAAEPSVSVAQWFARDTGLKPGDRLTVDIQGVLVTAQVTSIRRVPWLNRRANFTFVFQPSALEQAPAMFATALREPDERARVRLQEAVVSRMPNVNALDVEMIFRIIQTFMDRIGLVVRFMAGFCIAVGLVILAGAIATTRYQRIREAVLLKTLGATRGTVARVLLLEYLLLGSLAGLVGAIAAGALSWGLVTHVFEGAWSLTPGAYLITWAAAVLVITGTGLGSSLDVLMKKPLEVLRED